VHDLNADLTLALELADVADGSTIHAHRSGGFEVTIKPDGSPVTDVDVAVEQAIRDVLADRRPDDGVIGEEFGGEEFGGDPAGSRRWVLDPIDGTSSFARRGSVWGTLIALEIDGVPTVGVVSMPVRGSRWWGAVGAGAFVTTPESPEPSSLSAAGAGRSSGALRVACVPAPEALQGEERRAGEALAGLGSLVPFSEWTTYPPLMVADGSLDACLHIGAHWDVAALGAVVLAAGGSFHVGPASHRYRTLGLAASRALEPTVLDALGWPR
jgi:histidinol-phosphatase